VAKIQFFSIRGTIEILLTEAFFYYRYKAWCGVDISMSENKKEKQLENAQNDQDEVGAAAEKPETSGPAENVREKAAKTEEKSQDAREPA
jgi:hypothetical protein